MKKGSFSADSDAIRRRARQRLSDDAVTDNDGGTLKLALSLLNDAVATEVVCILRYKFHAICATELPSEAVKQEFIEHAREEEAHLDMLTERITQLGGRPDLDPTPITARAASQYAEGETLLEMIQEDLVAERIAIEIYRDLVRYFGHRDPTTRILLEKILAQEEEHASDMHDLLVAHQRDPAAADR